MMWMLRKILWFCLFVVLFCIGIWFIGWPFIKSEVESRIAQFIENEQHYGREWKCEEPQLKRSGLEVSLQCSSVTLETEKGQMSSGKTRISVKIYSPFTVSLVINGPLRWQGHGRFVTASADVVKVEAHIRNNFLEEGLVDIQHLQLNDASSDLIARLPREISAGRLTFKFGDERQNVGDLSITAQGIQWPFINERVQKAGLFDLEGNIALSKSTYLRRLSLSDFEMWRLNGGSTHFLFASQIEKKEFISFGGTVRLDEEKKPEGEFIISTYGITLMEIVNLLLNRPMDKVNNGTSAIGKDNVQEKKYELTFKQGRVFLNMLKKEVAVPGVFLPSLF